MVAGWFSVAERRCGGGNRVDSSVSGSVVTGQKCERADEIVGGGPIKAHIAKNNGQKCVPVQKSRRFYVRYISVPKKYDW